MKYLEYFHKSIDREFESFLTCPTCQAKYSATGFDISFENIGNDCFTAHCQHKQCGTNWGLQRCGQCQTNYPYIKLGGANPEISDRSVGWCDHVFGRDVLLCLVLIITHSSIFVLIVEVVVIPHNLVLILVSDVTPESRTAKLFNLLI